MTKEIKMEFNRDDLWRLREVLRGFIGTQIVDGHTYMLDEAIELKNVLTRSVSLKPNIRSAEILFYLIGY